MEQEFNPQFQKIGDILVHEGKISDSQLNSALAEQKVRKEKLGTVLLDQGLITEEDLVKVYSMQLGYELASDEALFSADPEVVQTIPEDFARQNMVLALRKSDTTIVIAMEDPEDLVAIDSLKRLTSLNPEVLVASPSGLNRALDQIYGKIRQAGEVEEAVESIKIISGDEENQEEVDLSPDKVSTEDAPIVKLVNLILQEAIKERATDIHLEPQQDIVIVRIESTAYFRLL